MDEDDPNLQKQVEKLKTEMDKMKSSFQQTKPSHTKGRGKQASKHPDKPSKTSKEPDKPKVYEWPWISSDILTDILTLPLYNEKKMWYH